MAIDVEFQSATSLEPEDARTAAELAYLAFEDFYSLFSANPEKVLPAISRHFTVPTELNQVIVAREAGSLVGISAFYALAEMPARQMQGLRLLLETADDTQATLRGIRAFASNFEPPGDKGGYIARFSVAPEKRGSGIAQELLRQTEASMVALQLPEARLHVRRDNGRAIAFYERAGYELLDAGARGYRLMGKALR